MRTKLLPIVAILSAMSFTAQADNNNTNAYVTDTYGNIVMDSYGACTRSINWTAETALARCEKNEIASATQAVVANKPKKACATKTRSDIKDNGLRGYAIDSDGDVVRDSWGACVRTIEWTEATEIARCEGKEEVVVVEEVIVVAPVVAVVPVVAPAPAVVPAPVVAPAKSASLPTVATFRGFFDTNSATLKHSAHEELDTYAKFMKAQPNSKVTITGHTDSRGEASYNQVLSEKRANAVKAYLVNKGISANRMETHGAGETNPIADNNTAEGRAHNRRVDVELIK
ncbi:MAG: OmpA family protein [Thiomicrorhabdus sp.]|nr:OmpA family protein [Thiomicrorhabdus sp.]